MKSVRKTGEVSKSPVRAEVKVGYDHLLPWVEAEHCVERGAVYFSTETLQQLDRLRDEFARKQIIPRSVG